MKYINVFETHSNYNTYITGQNKILPNISYCKNEDDVHYNPFIPPETRVIAKFNVTSTSESTRILGVTTYITEIEIDNIVLQGNFNTSYTFNTTGEHIVKYTINANNNTALPVYYPTHQGMFTNCTNLISVYIPNFVTTLGESTFVNCNNLTSITCDALIAPTSNGAFHGVATNGTLYVPNGSTGYDVWMGSGDNFLGYYNWTKIEQ